MNPANSRTRSHVAARRPGERGNVLVFTAFSLVGLLGAVGLGVDYGFVTYDAMRLQQACDYGALAGALKLKQTPWNGDTDDNTAAETDALLIAREQMSGIASPDVTFLQNNTRIQVRASFTRQHFFLPVLGRNETTITRQATAEASVLTGVPGVAPLAITSTDYDNFKSGIPLNLRIVRNQDEDFNAGEVLAVSTDDTPSKSPSAWEDEVRTGVRSTVRIGQDTVNSVNADGHNQGDRLVDALKEEDDSRIERAAGAPWRDLGSTFTYPNYPADDPRLMTIIVTDAKAQTNGTSWFVVRRLVAVYLEDAFEVGDEAFMRVRILPYRAFNSETPGIIIGSPGSVNSGIYVIRLIDDMPSS